MDNVLVDFQSGLDQTSEETKAKYAGRLDEIPGLFGKMKPMEGAVEAVRELQKHYDLFILSTAPWKNPSAWSDKVEWVTKYLDDVFHKRMVITYAGRLDEIPGLFGKMKPMEGAVEAVRELQKHYDLFILSTAPWKNPSAWSDKVEWVTKYLDDVFHKRMVITHRKDLCKGDYLIDDRAKNGASDFEGEWIEFGSEKFPDWASVLDYLNAVL